MRFFFFLKLHLIKVQWSAAVQTSNCLTSNPDGLWRFLLALLPSEAFELDSYVMACVCGDLMPAKLRWEALNMSLQTGHLSRPRASFHQHHLQFRAVAWKPFHLHVEQIYLAKIPAFFVFDCLERVGVNKGFSCGRGTRNVIYPSDSCWCLGMWYHMCGKETVLCLVHLIL